MSGRSMEPERPRPDADALERLAARALREVPDGALIGLGSGHTAAALVRALGRRVREGLRVRGVPTSEATGRLAREVGVPPWKLKTIRTQARGWDPRSLAVALRVVAAADADVKGAAGNSEFALERAVLAICRAGDT